MPKLSQSAIESKKEIIETASKDLFIKQGFHATSMRDIAKAAEVSLGNLYNYYETKEAIYQSIIKRYAEIINEKVGDIFSEIDEPLEPVNLRRFGQLVGDLVNNYSDFWLLMYIDVLEFENRHFRLMFEGLTERFSKIYGQKFKDAKERGDLRTGVEPSVAFTAAYMQFFNYFLVEKLFGGNRHLGLSDDQALNHLTKIFAYGTLSDEKLSSFKKLAFGN